MRRLVFPLLLVAAACGNDANPKTATCDQVVCNDPPAKHCADSSTLVTFDPAGRCDQGVCAYVEQQIVCPQGCADDACVGDPCLGVTCNAPPAATCDGD